MITISVWEIAKRIEFIIRVERKKVEIDWCGLISRSSDSLGRFILCSNFKR